MSDRVKTKEAARLLGVPMSRLHRLLGDNRLRPPPAKDSRGDLWWSPEDLERARAALKRRKPEHRQASAPQT
jgi:hypothetical protein